MKTIQKFTKLSITNLALIASATILIPLTGYCQNEKSNVKTGIKVNAPAVADSYEAQWYYAYEKNGNNQGRQGGLTTWSGDTYLYTNGTNQKLNFGLGTNFPNNVQFSIRYGRGGSPVFYSPNSNTVTRIISQGPLSFYSGGRGLNDDNAALTISQDGSLTVGNTSMQNLNATKVTVNGYSQFGSGRGNTYLPYSDGNNYLSSPELIIRDENDRVKFYFDNKNGRIGIGNSLESISSAILNKYSMFVTKGILSENFAIAKQGEWADYVFKENYKLNTLSQVDTYIQKNGHLPDMPSAEQVAESGYSLHEINVKFLRKIEELTLYSITQEKIITQLGDRISALEAKIVNSKNEH